MPYKQRSQQAEWYHKHKERIQKNVKRYYECDTCGIKFVKGDQAVKHRNLLKHVVCYYQISKVILPDTPTHTNAI